MKKLLQKSILMLLVLFISTPMLFSAPTDNPYKTIYDLNSPLWTDSLGWSTAVTITNYKLPEETDWDNALQKAFTALGAAGGNVFFPAGTYNFGNSVVLPSKVVLRGETPAQTNAKLSDFATPSRLVFPKYIPVLSGNGTDNATAFKTITTN